MKTNAIIVAIAAGLASVESTGMLVDPPPRPISDDFRSKLPPTIRGLPERDLQKLPNDFVSKKYGRETAQKFNDFTGPCAGIPRQPGRSTVVQPGRSAKFSFDVQNGSSDARCKLTLSCPNKAIERTLWSGDCRDAKTYSQDVMIPRDVGPCVEGECYVQWLMETKADKFCNCADVVVEPPPGSTYILSSTSISSSSISSSVTRSSISSAYSLVTTASPTSSPFSSSYSIIPTLSSKILIPSLASSISSRSSSISPSSTTSGTITSISSVTSTSSSLALISTSSKINSISLSSNVISSTFVPSSASNSATSSSGSASPSFSSSSAVIFTEKINSVTATIGYSTDLTITCTTNMVASESCPTCRLSIPPTSTCFTCSLSMIPTSSCSTCTVASLSSDLSIFPIPPTNIQSSSIALPTNVCSTCATSGQETFSVPQFTTISSSSSGPIMSLSNIYVTVTEKNAPVTQTQTIAVNSSGKCPSPTTATSIVSVPITVTEVATSVSQQSVISISTATVTTTESITAVFISTDKAVSTVTFTQTDQITATETLVNLQKVTATSVVTDKAVSFIPTTYVSTMIMTEKMLPVTIYMTSTATQPGQINTLVERISETATITSTRIENSISYATSTTTALSIVSLSGNCAPITFISNVPVPTTITSIVTVNRPITLTQKNVMTVIQPGQVVTSTIRDISTTIATVTQISSIPMACPLQEKTITRIMTATSNYPINTSSPVPVIVTTIPTFTSPVMTSKAIPIITSSMNGGSLCPTPIGTSGSNSAKAQITTSIINLVSKTSGSCQEGQKRCDMYDRRQFNECRGGQWSSGISMTEADNMQCEESNGMCKLVPIPASNFHV